MRMSARSCFAWRHVITRTPSPSTSGLRRAFRQWHQRISRFPQGFDAQLLESLVPAGKGVVKEACGKGRMQEDWCRMYTGGLVRDLYRRTGVGFIQEQ